MTEIDENVANIDNEKITIDYPVTISDITGGEIISDRDIGDQIIIDDVTDTYNRFPGAGASLDKAAFTAFKNGFTEDLDMKRRLEFIRCEIWKKEFGYSCIYVDKDKNIIALHPRTYQIGFVISRIDNFGRATEIQMQWKPDEKAGETFLTYQRYNETKGEGFFWFRSFRGLLGLRGLSHLLTLVDPLRVQNALFLEYMKHGEWQSINHPVAKIKDLNDTTYERVKADLRAPEKDRAVVIDAEDDFYYDGPMAKGSSWDPTGMLEYGDKIISRETGLLLSMLTGDPMGYLSASESTKAEWFDGIKQYQAIILPEYKPVLKALGFTDNIQFQEPYEPPFETKLEGIKLAREALEGLVPPEQLVNIINKIMGYEEEERLTVDPNYQKMKQLELENQQFQDKNNHDQAQNNE